VRLVLSLSVLAPKSTLTFFFDSDTSLGGTRVNGLGIARKHGKLIVFGLRSASSVGQGFQRFPLCSPFSGRIAFSFFCRATVFDWD